MKFPYENIIFEGGGIKGVAYAKVPLVLKEMGILKQIKRIAGSSAGSIAATLLAVKYSPEMIDEIITTTDFKEFQDETYYSFTAFKFLFTLGINTGDYFCKWIQNLIMVKTGNKDTTFLDIYNENNIELVITGTSIKEKKTKYFSYKTTPDMPIWKAVRISITIPIFFKPIQYIDSYYIDGGILSNFPIWIFDNPNSYEVDYENKSPPSKKTLGFKLVNNTSTKEKDVVLPGFGFLPIVNLAFQLIMLLLDYIDESYTLYDYWDRTVGIDVMDVDATEFNTDVKKLEILRENGYKTTKKFLENKIYFDKLKKKIKINY